MAVSAETVISLPLSESSSGSSQESVPQNIESIKAEIKTAIASGDYFHRQKTKGIDGKSIRSSCWEVIHEIIDATNNNIAIPNYFYCTQCHQVIYSKYKDSCTNKLNRHNCKKKLLHPITKKDKDKLKFAAAKYVANDMRPYYMVECSGFKSFCFEVMSFGQSHPNASINDLEMALPCRNTVREGVRQICEESQEFIKMELQKAKEFGSIAAVVDVWTDDHVHESYLGVIAIIAYETPAGSITHKKYTLQINKISELVKSKEVVMKYFYESLQLYGLSIQDVKKYVIVVHDRGGNIRYGMLDDEIPQILCYCHLINNLVGKMIQYEEAKSIVSAASELTAYMKNCGLCVRLAKTLKTYCHTRWNSVYLMFASIIENYTRIVEVLTEKNIAQSSTLGRSSSQKKPLDYLLNIDITAIQEITNFLKPFKEMTMHLEGHEKPNLHVVWPIHSKIHELLQPDLLAYDNLTNGFLIEEMKAAGSLYMRVNLQDFEPTDMHKISTILHPLLKDLAKLSTQERDDAYRIVDKLVKQMQPEDVVPAPRSQPQQSSFSQDFLNDFCGTSEIYLLILIDKC